MGIRTEGASAEGGEDASPKLCQECAISELALPRVGKEDESIRPPRKYKEGLFIRQGCQRTKHFRFLPETGLC